MALARRPFFEDFRTRDAKSALDAFPEGNMIVLRTMDDPELLCKSEISRTRLTTAGVGEVVCCLCEGFLVRSIGLSKSPSFKDEAPGLFFTESFRVTTTVGVGGVHSGFCDARKAFRSAGSTPISPPASKNLLSAAGSGETGADCGNWSLENPAGVSVTLRPGGETEETLGL